MEENKESQPVIGCGSSPPPEPELRQSNSHEPTHNQKPLKYTRYFRDKIMEINPLRVPCSFKEVLEDNARESLSAISDRENLDISSNYGAPPKLCREFTMSDPDVAMKSQRLWFPPGGAVVPCKSDPCKLEFEQERNSQNSHLLRVKSCLCLDKSGRRSGRKFGDGTCTALADYCDVTDVFKEAPNVKRLEKALEEQEEMSNCSGNNKEITFPLDHIYDRTRLSLSQESGLDQELSAWLLCPYHQAELGYGHVAPGRRSVSSKDVTQSSPVTVKKNISSGSSENINTNWKPAEGSISNTKTKHKSISARAGSATAKPPLNKEKPPREPSVLPSPHLPDINYEFLHNQSHRIYMHIYRSAYTDQNLFTSLGIPLSGFTRDLCIPKVHQINCRDVKCGSTLKVCQFHFKITSLLRTNKPKQTKRSPDVDTPTTSPAVSPVAFVCRSRPTIPSNARGVVCPTSMETPSHIVAAKTLPIYGSSRRTNNPTASSLLQNMKKKKGKPGRINLDNTKLK